MQNVAPVEMLEQGSKPAASCDAPVMLEQGSRMVLRLGMSTSDHKLLWNQ
jgi:hypothetical protein